MPCAILPPMPGADNKLQEVSGVIRMPYVKVTKEYVPQAVLMVAPMYTVRHRMEPVAPVQRDKLYKKMESSTRNA